MLDLAEKTGVHLHLSHLSATFDIHPKDEKMQRLAANRALEIIDEYRSRGVRVSYDTICYYSGGDFYYPQIANRFLPYVMQAGGMQAFSNALKIGNYKEKIAQEIKAGKHPSSSVMTVLNPVTQPNWGDDMPITKCKDKFYEGKTIGELTKELNKNYVDVLLDILEADPYATYYMWGGRTIHTDWHEFFKRDDMCISLDCHSRNYDYEAGEIAPDLPKNYAATSCYGGLIQYLVMHKNIMPIEKMVRQMSTNGADALGLKDRGRIQAGLAADVVVLDYETLSANEDFENVRQRPSGIDFVIVNGEIAVENKVYTHCRSGQILRR